MPRTGRPAPQRTCVGCRRVAPATELVRVVRTEGGDLRVGRREPGRGAWLCRGSPGCLERALQRRALERALKGPVGPRGVAELAAALREPAADVGT